MWNDIETQFDKKQPILELIMQTSYKRIFEFQRAAHTYSLPQVTNGRAYTALHNILLFQNKTKQVCVDFVSC